MSQGILQFTVYGKPEPQGSSRAFVRGGRAVITSDNPKMKGWRGRIAVIAYGAMNEQEFPTPAFGRHVPVSVDVEFRVLRPKSAKKDRIFPVVRPDADKLLRATFDALTKIAYHDDAQVVNVTVRKRYGTEQCMLITIAAVVA